jgi:hypothetical protein
MFGGQLGVKYQIGLCVQYFASQAAGWTGTLVEPPLFNWSPGWPIDQKYVPAWPAQAGQAQLKQLCLSGLLYGLPEYFCPGFDSCMSGCLFESKPVKVWSTNSRSGHAQGKTRTVFWQSTVRLQCTHHNQKPPPSMIYWRWGSHSPAMCDSHLYD